MMAECWSEGWERSEEVGAPVRLHHWAECSNCVDTKVRVKTCSPSTRGLKGTRRSGRQNLRQEAESVEGGGRTPGHPEKAAGVSYCRLWPVPCGWGFLGGVSSRGGGNLKATVNTQHLGFGSLVANSTPVCPMEARKSRRSTVWILKSTRTVTGAAGESDRESGVNLQKVWGGPPGLQWTSQGVVC